MKNIVKEFDQRQKKRNNRLKVTKLKTLLVENEDDIRYSTNVYDICKMNKT